MQSQQGFQPPGPFGWATFAREFDQVVPLLLLLSAGIMQGRGCKAFRMAVGRMKAIVRSRKSPVKVL